MAIITRAFSPRIPLVPATGAVPVTLYGAGGVGTSEQVATKTVAFDGTQGPSTAATLSTALAGANNDLDYTAATAGSAGNSITIAYIDPGANDAVLGVVVTGNAIVVNLATGVAGAITSTAGDIDTAIAALPAAAALVNVANKAANDGTGVVIAMAATALAGGLDPTATLFTVTGVVNVKLFARCTVDLAGASATVSVGTALATAGLLPLTTATTLDANELWLDATPDTSIEAVSGLTSLLVAQDIIQTVGTAAITSGTLIYYCVWAPVSADGAVVAA